jgi:hypothetical protein
MSLHFVINIIIIAEDINCKLQLYSNLAIAFAKEYPFWSGNIRPVVCENSKHCYRYVQINSIRGYLRNVTIFWSELK